MPKTSTLTESPIAIRVDAATQANVDHIIASGLAADRSAALRAAAAITARLLTAGPHVYAIIGPGGRIHAECIFGTHAAAAAWLQEEQGATEDQAGDEWVVVDEDGDPESWWQIVGIVPR